MSHLSAFPCECVSAMTCDVTVSLRHAGASPHSPSHNLHHVVTRGLNTKHGSNTQIDNHHWLFTNRSSSASSQLDGSW